MKINQELAAFNRGLISKLALARVDLKRTAMSAEEQTNWMPRSLGSMMLRPGWEYLGSSRNDAVTRHLPFVFSADDTAIVEMTPNIMRVRVDDQVITRVSVSSAVTNGAFTSNVTGWTNADESGATSQWATGGYLSLTGTGYNAAIRRQQVTVGAGDQNKEHALAITVARGEVYLKVGSSSGGEQYVAETLLVEGIYSLAFTPTGNFHIELAARTKYASLVDSVNVEGATEMAIATPYGAGDLSLLRRDQSGDVIFVTCDGQQQRRVARYGTRSWALEKYLPADGPFRVQNTTTITLTPSGLSGDITLTASRALFRSTHVGALFRLTSIGQTVSGALNGAAQYTNYIHVSGVGTNRIFTIVLTGVWTATVTLQQSIGEPGAWTNVTSYTGNTSSPYDDGLANQVIYYRLGINTGNYTSGTVTATLSYGAGSLKGVCRVTAYSSATSVSAVVLSDMGGTTATTTWEEGEWSDYRGWPSACAFFEGRFWQAGRDKIIGSVSDAFDSFDDETEGDSGPINRSIGSGPVDTINWLLPLQRLLLGGQGAEHSVRSNTFDEPLTPTNFNLRSPSTQGSAAVEAEKIDSRGVFVQAAGTRLFELAFDAASSDYVSSDLTVLCPEVAAAGITRLAVQRQPDTRVHCVLDDGTVAVLVTDPAEDVRCWVTVETDGTVEDAFVLPGAEEDQVYYQVLRTINGSPKRHLERWAMESECVGGTLNKQADSFVTYSGAATTTVTAAHLAGETVVVWGDGADLGTVTLDGSGVGTLPSAVTSYCAGLAYAARYKSTKLAYAAGLGTALTQRKRVNYLGLILANTHAQGLRFGPDFDNLDDLPLVEDGAEVDGDYVWAEYDKDAVEFPGTYDTDSRVCLEAAAPRPCTVLAAVIGLQTSDKG